MQSQKLTQKQAFLIAAVILLVILSIGLYDSLLVSGQEPPARAGWNEAVEQALTIESTASQGDPNQGERALATELPTVQAGESQGEKAPATPLRGLQGGEFQGERALEDLVYQVSLGPRIPGSPGHDQVTDWIQAELETAGWDVSAQQTTQAGQPVKNIIAKAGEGGEPWIVLGAHYDSRILADRDPDMDKRSQPVPGANDAASGVAVLLELARVLPEEPEKEIWLVFFDAEDNGNIEGWDWILGSRAFVASLKAHPDAAVIVDMVGDADLNLYFEMNSNQQLSQEIWDQASRLGYNQFIAAPKHSLLDDHTPFLQAGIPAVDIIDFDYPYWHTTADTPDKVSAESLEAVGETLRVWLTGPDRP